MRRRIILRIYRYIAIHDFAIATTDFVKKAIDIILYVGPFFLPLWRKILF